MINIDEEIDIDIDKEIAKDLSKFYDDPLAFVIWAFPWGEGNLKGFDGPDKWQIDLLTSIGEEVKDRGFDGINSVEPLLYSIASGHGIGKSTIVAWLILWIMSTRPYCKGTVTANTSKQLHSKTWPELGKWYNIFIAKSWFTYNSGHANMYICHKNNRETWRCDAQTCNEENSESFAGQHAAGSTSFYIFDEASAIPSKIWEVSKGGLTDGEPMQFAFGNPTRNTGEFKDTFTKNKHRWKNMVVDSRDVKITNKVQIQAWVDDYGENSDFVKVRVRGIFPSQSFKQFISEDLVDNAYKKHIDETSFSFAPSVIGVDPAWTGEDEFVIIHRKGLFCEVLGVFEKNDDDIRMANIIAEHETALDAKAVFIDMGYGTGIVSAGKAMGRTWHIIGFNGKSPDQGYLNMRAYMWGQMKEWLKSGATIPDDPVLRYDIIAPETVPRIDGRIQLESKNDMKKRGLQSPNRADALCLTFAMPVSNRLNNCKSKKTKHDFHPYMMDYDNWSPFE